MHAAVRGDGETLTLEVSNSGPSVDPQHTDRLFEPFYRASPRVRNDRTGHGLGLGLAITRAIVQAHHGTITATARPEGGLVVRADFPAGTRT
ncbi:ATP-binding protein [Streptomyces sp. M19]